MRRKPGAVLPLEVAILSAAVEFAAASTRFHGFLLAKHLRDADGARLLTAHGTLYKALSRMEKAGWLISDWEDPSAGEEEGRPRRRLYEVTTAGRAALVGATQPAATAPRAGPGWSPA
jgi:DNA-binding PadR family transcriptional regulator